MSDLKNPVGQLLREHGLQDGPFNDAVVRGVE